MTRKTSYQIPSSDPSLPTPDSGLYLVATPIGNLGDISLRALHILAHADVIACEDTRVTAKLLAAYSLKTPLTPYHDHNAEKARPLLIRRLKAGEIVALVSDAGTPLISDPGYRLVRDCRAENIPVTTVPGSSAILSALQLSTLPTDRFFFGGFLPPKPAAREKKLADLKDVPATLVFYETTTRLTDSLDSLSRILGDRPAAVVREITKKFEESRTGTLSGLAAYYAEHGAPKGEIVVVVGPPEEKACSAEDLDAALETALATHSVKDAAASVAAQTGLPRKQVYARALALAEKT